MVISYLSLNKNIRKSILLIFICIFSIQGKHIKKEILMIGDLQPLLIKSNIGILGVSTINEANTFAIVNTHLEFAKANIEDNEKIK
jgi:hypothetical protein